LNKVEIFADTAEWQQRAAFAARHRAAIVAFIDSTSHSQT
jgi:hypothetical protein